MSKVLDRATFEARLAAAQEAIQTLTPQTDALRKKLGDLLADGEEEQAKKVQLLLEEKLKELDRAKIQFIFLESRRPLVEKEEAKVRLEEIESRRRELRKGREPRHADVLSRLNAIIDDVADITTAWHEERTLQAEAEYCALLAEVPLPTVPAYPAFDYHELNELLGELLNRARPDAPAEMQQWSTKKMLLQQERRKHAFQKNGKRK